MIEATTSSCVFEIDAARCKKNSVDLTNITIMIIIMIMVIVIMMTIIFAAE